jgi:hypothetical protein
LRLKHADGHFKEEKMNAPVKTSLDSSERRNGGIEQRLTETEYMLVQTIEFQHQLVLAINELQSRMDSLQIRGGTFEEPLGMAVGYMSRDQAGHCQDSQQGSPPVPAELATKADIEDVKHRISACAGRLKGTHLNFQQLSQRMLTLEDLTHRLHQLRVQNPATPRPLETVDEAAVAVGSTCKVVSLQQPVERPLQQPWQQQRLSPARGYFQHAPSRAQNEEQMNSPSSVRILPHKLNPQVMSARLPMKPLLADLGTPPAPQAQLTARQHAAVTRPALEELHERLTGRVSGIVSSFSANSLNVNVHPQHSRVDKHFPV